MTRENPMSDSRADDKAAIQAVLVDSYQAWEKGDADGMVADYTADATAIMTGSLRNSRDVIRDSMALAFEGALKGSSTYNKQLSLRFVGRDAAIVVSESGILFAGETEVPDTDRVNATWVFEKRDGQWLIAAYHKSLVLAPGRGTRRGAERGRGRYDDGRGLRVPGRTVPVGAAGVLLPDARFGSRRRGLGPGHVLEGVAG